jgi:hypothetical protein
MDLVGPRPERPEFTPLLSREVDGYMQRLLVRPGVTGLAQINLPPDSDFDSVRRKLVLDLDYIRAAGPGLDARILCWTALRLVGLKGLTTRYLGLSRKVVLPTEREPQHASPADTAIRLGTVDTVEIPHHGKGHSHNGSSHNGTSHMLTAQAVKPR